MGRIRSVLVEDGRVEALFDQGLAPRADVPAHDLGVELGVELRLGTPVTRALIERMAPDVVLVAVGARRERPALPPISDAGGPRIFDGDALRQLLTGSGRNSGASMSNE